MTSLPDTKFNIPGRGVIASGYFADMALLDLDRYDGEADFAVANRTPTGVEGVYVNGLPAYSPTPMSTPSGSGVCSASNKAKASRHFCCPCNDMALFKRQIRSRESILNRHLDKRALQYYIQEMNFEAGFPNKILLKTESKKKVMGSRSFHG